ncbi:MAG: SMC-Scp complex subunit ScpB, partial [Steroidobacteraceae bacterium]
SLDDLPTLAELRDLEDIREQLDLPAAIPTAEAALGEEPAATAAPTPEPAPEPAPEPTPESAAEPR